MNTQADKVYNYILEHTMIQSGDRIVVGLSGGADSVSLLLLLAELGEKLGYNKSNLVAVHVHHGLRGEEADRDAEFAKALCERIGIAFVLYHTDIKAFAKENKYTVEEAGRIYRYECFAKTCEHYDCNKIAVAHNKNDFAETVLFHIVRGSGMNGLRGILPVRDNVIRPILCLERAEVLEYLTSKNETYCEDSTNASGDYDRNRIRHAILPMLQTINEGALSHICNLTREATDYYDWAFSYTEEAYTKAVYRDGRYLGIIVDHMNRLPSLLRRNICYKALTDIAGASKDITSKHVQALLGLFEAQSGREVMLPYGISARRSYDSVLLSVKQSDGLQEDLSFEREITQSGVYAFNNVGTLTVSIVPREEISEISKNKYTKMLDYDKIKGKLFLRTPKTGDCLIIDDAGNTKKISRLFIDAKIDRDKRVDWPIVACETEVLVVVGIRESYKYRIDSQTSRVLVLHYEGKGEKYGRED